MKQNYEHKIESIEDIITVLLTIKKTESDHSYGCEVTKAPNWKCTCNVDDYNDKINAAITFLKNMEIKGRK